MLTRRRAQYLNEVDFTQGELCYWLDTGCVLYVRRVEAMLQARLSIGARTPAAKQQKGGKSATPTPSINLIGSSGGSSRTSSRGSSRGKGAPQESSSALKKLWRRMEDKEVAAGEKQAGGGSTAAFLPPHMFGELVKTKVRILPYPVSCVSCY